MGPIARISIVTLISVTSAACCGCRPTAPARMPAAATTAPTAPRPAGKILFQPYFYYEFTEPKGEGTGFIIRTDDDRLAAVTCANILKLDGSRLTGVRGLSIGDWTPLVSMQQSWGKPGSPGTMGQVRDMRNDYLIMPVEASLSPDSILELDDRAGPTIGEPIWFPARMESEPRGYELRDGFVEDVKPGYIRVKLNKPMTLMVHNGSPIISATTGKVIGLLAQGEKIQQRSVLWLCPASSLRNAIKTAEDFPMLKDVVGKKGGH